jgi:CHAD domain-containing protein
VIDFLPRELVVRMTVQEVTFGIDSGELAREAVAGIRNRFRTRRNGRLQTRRTYYDTFDWRLHRDGGTLCAQRHDGRWLLRWLLLDGAQRHRSLCDEVPGFAWDLAPTPFRRDLHEIIEMRRLLPMVRVQVRGETLAILDGMDKTVARVHFEQGTASAGDEGPAQRMIERLHVVPVVGYPSDHASIARFLEEQFDLHRHDGGELALALDAVGTQPDSYSSKLDVPLDPGMRADEATKRILRALLETMRANEDGTRRDLDSEFLHDFRVAVRRTRSYLGQVKSVFDAQTLERYRGDFAWLGGISGPTRDLDVYLLHMREYLTELPETMRPGLAALESHLQGRQKTEQRRLARALASERYTNLLRDWSEFLNTPGSDARPGGCDAARSVRELAAERIRNAFRRVHRRGEGLSTDTPPETVHRLRIDCKKLRYLLEFFRNVFEPKSITPMVHSLRQLQDHLGDFNDLELQQRELRCTAEEMLEAGTPEAGTLLAMGCLVGRLAQRQSALNRVLVDAVRSFIGDRNRASFRKLGSSGT